MVGCLMFMDWRTKCCTAVRLLKAIHGFNTIPVQILTAFFAEVEKPILKFLCNLYLCHLGFIS